MRYDSLSEPVSDDEPSGPDLDEAMDNDYLNYTMLVDGKMPSSYFVRAEDGSTRPFDRSSIDIDDEMETIEGLLRRTRDARLLSLAARLQALSGSIVGYCEVVEGVALMVSSLWDTFYPRESDGDFIIRQNTLEGLDDQVQVVLPLQFAIIGGGGRTTAVSLRNYLVATGKAQLREGEQEVAADTVAATLAAEGTREAVLEVHAAIMRALDAFAAITKVFYTHDATAFAPSFTKAADTLKAIADLIAANRPELRPAEALDGGVADDEGPEGATGGGQRIPAGAVKSHETASLALTAVERYLLALEPSSPALVLVHQARMLIGRPLVEALDALMPSSGSRATFRFDAGFQFDIDLSRMRSITEHMLTDAALQPEPEPEPEQVPEPDAQSLDSTSGETEADEAPGWGDASDWVPGASEDGAAEGTEASGDGAAAEEGEAGSAVEPQEAATEPPQTPPSPPAAPEKPRYDVASRSQAGELIAATEGFFRQVEPSSAIPVLLSKARGYLNRDFASILSDLLPKETY